MGPDECADAAQDSVRVSIARRTAAAPRRFRARGHRPGRSRARRRRNIPVSHRRPAAALTLVPPSLLTLEGFTALLAELKRRGHRLLGPTVCDGVIAYADIDSAEDLPRGWTDEQSGGYYRLRRRSDAALFGYAVGPQSWKPFLHPPIQRLWRAHKSGNDVQIEPEPAPTQRLAFIGARACELRALELMDRTLLGDGPGDPHYRARRRQVFIVAVNCSSASGTCFCASMNAGPHVRGGFDLALTELADHTPHAFVVQPGSDAGSSVLAALTHRSATAQEIDTAQAVVERTRAGMGRAMPSGDLHALLLANLEHPCWDDVAQRCLACGNCTMVCPTCLCTSVNDVGDLGGGEISRSRRWDSCFTLDFSHLHGGSIRHSNRSRYRQWMTHKLATSRDQSGDCGCVGCGRCITWCPVGIDITEEVRTMRGAPAG